MTSCFAAGDRKDDQRVSEVGIPQRGHGIASAIRFGNDVDQLAQVKKHRTVSLLTGGLRHPLLLTFVNYCSSQPLIESVLKRTCKTNFRKLQSARFS